MNAAARQRGLSMIGFLFTAGVLVVIALVGFRVLPSYIEYFSVKKALEATLADDSIRTAPEIRHSIDLRLNAEYVDSVRAADLQVQKQGNQIVASMQWQKVLHMVGNASILLEFNAEAAR